MHVIVGIPAYGGSIKTGCVNGLFSVFNRLTQMRIGHGLNTIDVGDVVRARNILAGGFLAHPKATHILFIDADMVPTGNSVARLIEMNEPLCGCVYRKRTEKKVFVLYTDDDRTVDLDIEDGVATVDGIGMGLCLIRREVFETMSAKLPLRRIRSDAPGAPEFIHAFFDRIALPDRDVSEDASFCRRWRDCGGRVRAILDEDVGHIGDMTFSGTLMAQHQVTG